jgi:hypothetical protein
MKMKDKPNCIHCDTLATVYIKKQPCCSMHPFPAMNPIVEKGSLMFVKTQGMGGIYDKRGHSLLKRVEGECAGCWNIRLNQAYGMGSLEVCTCS